MHAVSMMGLCYLSFPNHRSDQSWTEGDEGAARDFGEHILLTTKDHSVSLPPFFSFMFFQGFNEHVVHHLFPTVDKS